MNHSSTIFEKYLADKEMASIVSDDSLIKKMLQFEIALATAQAKLKIIPKDAAKEIAITLSKIKIELDFLTDSTVQNGAPVLGLLSQVKRSLSKEAGKWIHFGSTSQDTMDSAAVLIARDAVDIIRERTNLLIGQLGKIRKKFGQVVCMARTRNQLATPIKFGIKIDAWLQPLQRQLQRIQEISPRLFCVQLGGAAGDLHTLGRRGAALNKELAMELTLNPAESWHSQRDRFCELTNWLAIHCGILGKMGADILVMSQSEIGELTEDPEAGRSSSMPHKSNPVRSEALVALAAINANAQALELHSLVHKNERDGSTWILEWKNIPQMLIHTGVALKHSQSIWKTMVIHSDRMKKNVEGFLAKHENR